MEILHTASLGYIKHIAFGVFKREFKSDKVLLGKLTAYFAQGQALYAGFTNKMQVRRRKGSKGGRARALTRPPPAAGAARALPVPPPDIERPRQAQRFFRRPRLPSTDPGPPARLTGHGRRRPARAGACVQHRGRRRAGAPAATGGEARRGSATAS